MTAPQGIFTFNQITGVLNASVAFSLGITPSATSVTIPPMPGLTRLGTAMWSYGGSAIRMLPNSVIDSIRISRSGGATTWIVTILDRRWAWENGQISGEYNIESDGEIIPETEKTPRQLAELCLQAMGETGYDISAVPTDDRPYVNWDVTVPSQALQQLIEPYGLAVTLRLNNTVGIVSLGTGQPLPSNALSVEDSIEPQAVPTRLRVVSGPIQYALDLETEPVGLDTDNEIKPIDELSYRPAGGWNASIVEADCISVLREFGQREQRLAQESVFKWFRVKLREAGEEDDEETNLLPLPENAPIVRSVDQILPLIDEQGFPIGKGPTQASQRAFVWGKGRDGNGLGSNNTQDDVDIDAFEEKYKLNLDFQLDTELGVVKLSQFFTRREPSDPNLGVSIPGIIFVRCTIQVKEPETRALTRLFKQVDVDLTSPGGTRHEVREDVIPRYRRDDNGNWQDNETFVEEQLDFYINQKFLNFVALPGQTADYAGFPALHPDGAIRQVSYSIDTSGQASTKLTRNIERFDLSMSYDETKKRISLAAARQHAERERLRRPKRLEQKPLGGNG